MRSRFPILFPRASWILCLVPLFVVITPLRSAPEALLTNAALPPSTPVVSEHLAGSQTLTESVIVSTRTPVGEASIRLPAGSVVEISASKGDWIQIRKSPFSGWIKQAANSQGSESGMASKGPAPASASPSVMATPNPTASPMVFAKDHGHRETIGGESFLPIWIFQGLRNPDSPLHLILLAYAGFASLLLVILLFVVLRLWGTTRRTQGQPVLSLEAKTPPLPGFLDCPLCKAPLAIESLSVGSNLCPNCGGAFECE